MIKIQTQAKTMCANETCAYEIYQKKMKEKGVDCLSHFDKLEWEKKKDKKRLEKMWVMF